MRHDEPATAAARICIAIGRSTGADALTKLLIARGPQHLRQAARDREIIEDARHRQAAECPRGHDGHRFGGGIVGDGQTVQHPPSADGECIRRTLGETHGHADQAAHQMLMFEAREIRLPAFRRRADCGSHWNPIFLHWWRG
jgi:hypothetical protein